MAPLAGFHASFSGRRPFAALRARLCALALPLALIGGGAACNDAGSTSGSGTAPKASGTAATPAAASSSTSSGGFEIVDPPNPAMPWDFDLGVVPFGEVRERVVHLRNADGRPLAVKQVQTPCSCTTATLSYVDESGRRIEADKDADPMLVVPAGVTADLLVLSDTRLVPVQNAAKRLRLVLITDSATNPFLALEVHLIVELAFQAVPGTLRLGDVAENEGARASAKVVGLGVDGRKLTGIASASPGVTATLAFDDGVVPDQWTLSVELAAPVERGPFERVVELATTGPQGDGVGLPVRVPIVGTGVPDFEIRPERLVFLGFEPETESVVEIIGHLSGQRLRVLALRPDAQAEGLIVANAVPSVPDDSGKSPRWRIVARLASRPTSELAGTLTVETDDQGTLSIPYVIAAREPRRP